VDPLALLVELADHARPNVLSPVVELLLKLVPDHLALLFHDENLVETARELPDAVGFERPGHRHLERPDAQLGGAAVVDAPFFECLQHVKVALPTAGASMPKQTVEPPRLDRFDFAIKRGELSLGS